MQRCARVVLVLGLVVGCDDEEEPAEGGGAGSCDCADVVAPLEAGIQDLDDRLTELETTQPELAVRVWEGVGTEVTFGTQGTPLCQLAPLVAGETPIACNYENTSGEWHTGDVDCVSGGPFPAGFVFIPSACGGGNFRHRVILVAPPS